MPETVPFPEPVVSTEAETLARILDLVTLAERQRPAHRYISTRRLREAIIEGLT